MHTMLSRRQLVLIVTRSCLRVVRNIKKEEVWPAIQNFTDQVHHRNHSIMPVILPVMLNVIICRMYSKDGSLFASYQTAAFQSFVGSVGKL